MNKKNIVWLALLAFFLITAFNSNHATGMSWEEAQKSDKPIAVNFYVDWCHYCRKFAPTFDKLKNEYSGKYNFVSIKTDDPTNEKVVKKYNIQSFPSVFLIKGNRKLFVDQGKYSDIQEMRRELDDFLN